MTLDSKLRDLDAINRLGVWIRWATLGSGCHEKLSALDSMNILGLWMTYATLSHLLEPLDAMNNLEFWII